MPHDATCSEHDRGQKATQREHNTIEIFAHCGRLSASLERAFAFGQVTAAIDLRTTQKQSVIYPHALKHANQEATMRNTREQRAQRAPPGNIFFSIGEHKEFSSRARYSALLF